MKNSTRITKASMKESIDNLNQELKFANARISILEGELKKKNQIIEKSHDLVKSFSAFVGVKDEAEIRNLTENQVKILDELVEMMRK